MIENEYKRYRLPVLNSEMVEVESNYSNSKRIRNGQVLRFHVGKKQFEVRTENLASLMLLVADPQIVSRLMPRKMGKVRRVEKNLTFSFVAKQRYEKGDVINVVAPYIQTIIDDEELMTEAVKNSLKAGKSFKIKR
ncbi:MAG: hypothetical protein WC346_17075 [Methanogenium sp.]|jgi:hypothetical protein